jgi:hypothetical protein
LGYELYIALTVPKANHLKLLILFLRTGLRLSRESTAAVQGKYLELKVEPGEFSGKRATEQNSPEAGVAPAQAKPAGESISGLADSEM